MIVRRDEPPDWLLDAGLVDEAVYKAVTETPTPSLDRAMLRLTDVSGYSRLWFASAAILAATRGPAGRRAAVRGLASVGVASFVANLVLKPIARRRRPDPSELSDSRRGRVPGSSSFPSGHSASAFAFATAVGGVLPVEAIPIRALASLVAYSRVHTGVHYPADVLAGAFLGTTLAQLISRALDGRL